MSGDDQLANAVARMEGTVTAEIRHLSESVRSLGARMDSFITRHEAQAKDETLAANHDAVLDRLNKIERAHGWIIKGLAGAWVGGVGTVFTFGRKLF